MLVSEAIKARKSTRAFLKKKVEREKIIAILDAARWAPSGTNTQPWQVAVVEGEAKSKLEEKLLSAFDSGAKGDMDYHYYPEKWEEPYLARRRACGKQLYTVMEISREDKEQQKQQWAQNYIAFGAPTSLFFFMDSKLETGSYMDNAMFIQNIMLAAVEQGLATCPEAALGQYPKIIKKELGYPENCILLCGMALGYEDKEAKINSYRTPREGVENFTRFFA